VIHDEALPNCKIDRQKKRMKKEEDDDWAGLDTTYFLLLRYNQIIQMMAAYSFLFFFL
jgi:hypothetical protein